MEKNLSNATKQHSFVQGAMILSVSLIIVKILGLVYKVLLQDVIGNDGFGYYGVAYEYFNFALALAVSGIPTAVSRIVSKNVELNNYKNIIKIKKIVAKLAIFFGIAVFIIIFIVAVIFKRNDPEIYSILVIAPAIMFTCLMGVYRGYFNGLRNMYPHGMSEIIESTFRMGFGLFLSYYVKKIGLEQFASSGIVFGKQADSQTSALSIIAPYSAAAAILGVTISTVVGFLFLFFYGKIKGSNISKRDYINSPPANRSSDILKEVLAIIIPICIAAVVSSVSGIIDMVSIRESRINAAIAANPEHVSSMFSSIINYNKLSLDELSNYLYGIYTSMVTEFLNIIPAFAGSFGISILPVVTQAWVSKRKKTLSNSVNTVLKMTTLISLPGSLYMCVFSKQILNIVYPSNVSVEVASTLLSLLSLSIFLISIVSPINSMLQAIGRADLPVKFMSVGIIIKLISNYILMGIPEINIYGMAVGTFLCYGFMVVVGMKKLVDYVEIRLNFKNIFVKPLISSVISLFVGIILNGLLFSVIESENRVSNVVILLITVIFSGTIYLFLLFLLRGIDKYDIIQLPKGKKILKRLEKYRIIR